MPTFFREWSTTSYPSPGQAQRSVFIDADNDGDIDVLYQAVGDGSGWLYAEARGDGSYDVRSVADSPFSALTLINHTGSNYFVGDFDGDGDMDLHFGANGTSGSYFRNNGNETFSSVSAAGFPAPAEFGRQVVGDFDGDGDDDILYQAGGNGSAWSFAESNGNGTFTVHAQADSPFAFVTLPDHTTGNYFTADFDADGDLDIWVSADGAPGKLLLNNLGEYFEADNSTLPTFASAAKAVVADFDNDGDADILYQTGGAGSAWAYAESNGDGSFIARTQAESPFAGVTFVDHTGQNYRVGDINGDGRIDVVGGINGSSEEVYYQASGGVVINEVQTAGANAGDEFVELKNTTGADIDISGWAVVYRGPTGTTDTNVFTFPAGTIIKAGSHLLIANSTYDGAIAPDFTFNAGVNGLFSNLGGGIALREGAAGNSFAVDSVAWGTASATHAFREGGTVVAAPAANQSIERTDDSDVTSDDWVINPTPTPTRSPGPAGTTGDDYLVGSEIVDSINGLEGEDLIKGGGADDILTGGDDNDDLRGEDGDDELHGDAGDDLLAGGYGNDELHGGIGDDALKGGAGDDVMYGGSGDDSYYVTESNDLVIENPGEGYDTVHSYLMATYTMGASIEALQIQANGNYGGVGNALNNFIQARAGDNVLQGMGGDDEMHGGAGADTLWGGLHNDRLYGDTQDDLLYGEDGQDFLDGGAGNDTLNGGEGVDDMQGGAGNDTYIVTAGDFTYDTGGIDIVHSGIDWTLDISIENLLLTGTANVNGYGHDGANVMTGNSGDNRLEGWGAGDTLNGGLGNDVLVGGDGSDKLTGGGGSDTFLFENNDIELTSMGAIPERDTIYDFSLAEGDRIDLSGIDANWATGGDDAFTFVKAFTGHAGEARLFASNGATRLMLDVDGDGRSDFEVLIQGVTLTASDDCWVL